MSKNFIVVVCFSGHCDVAVVGQRYPCCVIYPRPEFGIWNGVLALDPHVLLPLPSSSARLVY